MKIDYDVDTNKFFLTFLQDTRSNHNKEISFLNINIIINTLSIINTEKDKLIEKIKNIKPQITIENEPHVVFYSYYNLEEEYVIPNAYKSWKIMIIGKKSLDNRFAGILETRLEFWNTYFLSEKYKEEEIINV